MDFFYSIKEDRCFETKIKRSVFVCSLRYVETITEAKEFISEISMSHKQATHNCWAYIVGEKGETFHFSDHGEPPGTAGKPILNALESHDMTNISAVVTRYFGGVKLGIRGLINAYNGIVNKTVELEKLIKLVKTKEFKIEVPYSFNDTLIYHLKKIHGKIVKTIYTEVVNHVFEVEEQDYPAFLSLMHEYNNNGTITFNES